MNIILFGGAGFIGTNLTIKLAENKNNQIVIVDSDKEYFAGIEAMNWPNVTTFVSRFDESTDFDYLLSGKEVIYHLVSTTIPATSNQKISEEIKANIISTVRLLEACVRKRIKKVVFMSSGGTIYGIEAVSPIRENTISNPISSYGLQKITIEKLLYLFWYMYGLDYRIIRLANPYGPYQRPNGILGAVTNFTYKALKGQPIVVYGDGSVVRDFIYIDDAVGAILKIVSSHSKEKIYNIGSGYGTSINELLYKIQKVLGVKLNIIYKDPRKVDVLINYLDISRYEKEYGKLNAVPLEEGIRKTAAFMLRNEKWLD